MSTQTSDVVVIGSGIVGASCASHLAARGLRVTVLEREEAPAMGSTGRSVAGVRVQFTTEANIRLSVHSLQVYRSFPERYGHEVGYRSIGYLLLATHERWDAHLASVELQRTLGAPVEVLTPSEALEYVPFEEEGLAGATYGPWDGVIDPHMATHAWVSLGREHGAVYRFGSPVTRIAREGECWRLTTADGSAVSCAHVVNAAGAWSGGVASLAGLDVPVGPKRIQIFLSAPIEDPRTYPLTVDLASGAYLRSEGNRVIVGLDNLDQEFGFSEGLDWEWMEQVLMTGLPRFPWWGELGIDRKGSWWGYYEVSPDHSPIIGPHPDAPSWIDACGFSGHGIMHAPATGLAVSELVADGESRTVDVGSFGHDRFGRAHPVEANIF